MKAVWFFVGSVTNWCNFKFSRTVTTAAGTSSRAADQGQLCGGSSQPLHLQLSGGSSQPLPLHSAENEATKRRMAFGKSAKSFETTPDGCKLNSPKILQYFKTTPKKMPKTAPEVGRDEKKAREEEQDAAAVSALAAATVDKFAASAAAAASHKFRHTSCWRIMSYDREYYLYSRGANFWNGSCYFCLIFKPIDVQRKYQVNKAFHLLNNEFERAAFC